jgi:tetratricopeptide (TPR) repeat protein
MTDTTLWKWLRFPVAIVSALLLVVPSGVLWPQATEQEPGGKLTLTSDSDEAKALLWQALYHGQNIFFLRAGELAQQALELDADFGLARVAHGFYATGLTSTERRAEMERGIAALASASTGELLVATALGAWLREGAEPAKVLFHAAAKLMPADPHLAFFAAWTTWLSGDQAGLDQLTSVTEKFPDHAATYNILAYGLWGLDDRDGGMRTVRKYVELAPEHPNSHDSHGEILQLAGRYDEAIDAYRRVNELAPEFLGGYTGIADVSALRGDYDEARAALTAALDHTVTKPAELNLRRAIGNTYLMEGNRRAALEQYEAVAAEAEANEMSSNAALNYRMLALADAVLGNGRSVESHIAKAGEVAGDQTPTHYAYAAWAHAEAGQLDAAREYGSKLSEIAAEQDDWRTPSHVINGLIHLQENEASDALSELRQADPADVMVRALLAQCYKETGQEADARVMRDDVMSDHSMNVYSGPIAVARIRAAKIK